jgi:hypothetical protein
VTQSEFDPISREPNYKQCAVSVERTPVASYADRRKARKAKAGKSGESGRSGKRERH